MRGHENVIAMRLSGIRPESVFLLDMPINLRPVEWLEDLIHVEVCTAGDAPEGLDLRFLVGLPVTVLGHDTKRARAISIACVRAGAHRVTVSAGEKNAIWTKEAGKWLSF